MQLSHIQQETSWEEHGFVRLKNALGELLEECPDFQHNRSFGKSWERIVALVRRAMDEYPATPPVTIKPKPDTVSSGLRLLGPPVAQRVRDSSSVKRERNQRQENIVPRPLRRSSSLAHSRNQSGRRSPLTDNGQQFLRSNGRSNSTTRY